MHKYIFIICCFIASFNSVARAPCSTAPFRQFDFWLGEWEAFGPNDSKAGDSKVSLLLDSCSLLEEWTSATIQKGFRYAGKSFNTYNAATNNWQQTWVDNTGGTNEYLKGSFSNNEMIFTSEPFSFKKDTMAIRRMTFTNFSPTKLRQHGEISKDNGQSWQTEYDLEYRRKTGIDISAINEILRQMETDYNKGIFKNIAAHYSVNGKVIGPGTEVSGATALEKYWEGFSKMGGNWKLTSNNTEMINGQVWQNGNSVITDKNGVAHKVSFTLLWEKEQRVWKILADRTREIIAETGRAVEEKQMFGGLCFMVDDKMCVGIEKDRMMLRLDPGMYESLLEKDGCQPMDFTGRVMKGYVYVDDAALRTKQQLSYWVKLALDYNLLVKPSRKKSKT